MKLFKRTRRDNAPAINEVKPMQRFSHYLTAADIPDGETEVTIVDFTNDKIRREHIPVIYFEGFEKGLALSERLLNEITLIIGRSDPATWAGERLLLYVTGFDSEMRQYIQVGKAGDDGAMATAQKFMDENSSLLDRLKD